MCSVRGGGRNLDWGTPAQRGGEVLPRSRSYHRVGSKPWVSGHTLALSAPLSGRHAVAAGVSEWGWGLVCAPGEGTGEQARASEQGSGQPGVCCCQSAPSFPDPWVATGRSVWREGGTDLTNPRSGPVINYTHAWAMVAVLSPDLLKSYLAQSAPAPAPTRGLPEGGEW